MNNRLLELISSLDNKKFSKVICGAGNEDSEVVSRYLLSTL